jgi:hypothetical protein
MSQGEMGGLDELVTALLRRVWAQRPAWSLGVRSAALPTEEQLGACVAAARVLLAELPSLTVIIGAWAEHEDAARLFVMRPAEAAARATAWRNSAEEGDQLLYLCSSATPGEAGLTGLYELTSAHAASALSEVADLPLLAALASSRSRQLRDKLEAQDLASLWEYLNTVRAQQADARGSLRLTPAAAAAWCAPALGLIPDKACSSNPRASWSQSWDRLLGVKAINRIKAALGALESYEDKAALERAIAERGIFPVKGGEVKRLTKLGGAAAKLASGALPEPAELYGLTQAALSLLMRGAGIINKLVREPVVAPDEGVEPAEDVQGESGGELEMLEALSGEPSALSLEDRELEMETPGGPVRIVAARGPSFVRRLVAAIPEQHLRSGDGLQLETSASLPSGAGMALVRADTLARPLAATQVELALTRFEAAREELIREAARRLSGAGMFEEDEAEEQTSELERALLLAHMFPLVLATQLAEQRDAYLAAYDELFVSAREHISSLSHAAQSWLLNLDLLYTREGRRAQRAMLAPLHPLRLARATLACSLGMMPGPMPESLIFNGSGRVIDLDRLIAQGEDLYEAADASLPAPEILAAAAAAGLHEVWSLLAPAGLHTAIEIEVREASAEVPVLDALAAALTTIFMSETSAGDAIKLCVRFSRQGAASEPVVLAGLREQTQRLLDAPDGDGPALRVERLVDPPRRRPVHLLIDAVSAPVLAHSAAAGGGAAGVALDYEVSPSGHIARVKLRGVPALESHGALLAALGRTDTPLLGVAEASAETEGALMRVLVARGGWPLDPQRPIPGLWGYERRDDHMLVTLVEEEIFERLEGAEREQSALRTLDRFATQRGLLALYELRKLPGQVSAAQVDERALAGMVGKLRVFTTVQLEATRPVLAVSLDSPEGLRWAELLRQRFGTAQRADLLLIEADEGMRRVESLRIVEIKAKETRAVWDLSFITQQAMLITARIESLRSELSLRELEALRALYWLGAGNQRLAQRWRDALLDLDLALVDGRALEVRPECWLVLHREVGQMTRETYQVYGRDPSGERLTALRDVELITLPLRVAASTPSQITVAAPVDPVTATLEEPTTPTEIEAASEADEVAPGEVVVTAVEQAEPTPATPAATARSGKIDMEARYEALHRVFLEFRVPVLRPAGDAFHEGPGFYVARFVPGHGTKASNLQDRADELKLKLGLDADQEIRTYIDRGAVVFEIPKRDEERYYIDAPEMFERATWPADSLYAPLGEDLRGEIIGVDLSSSDSPHLLIAGITGSGKSIALETLLHGLVRSKTPAELELMLVDPKGTELRAFEQLPHLRGEVGFDATDAITLLQDGVDEMDRRLAIFRTARVRSLQEYNRAVGADERVPWRLIVLDEYADLTSDKADRKKIEALLQRLAQKARSSGIHLIIATQKPSAEVISTTVRSNLGAQLALRVKTSSDSRVIMDEGGAETLAGKGDAFLKTSQGLVRLQCAKARFT